MYKSPFNEHEKLLFDLSQNFNDEIALWNKVIDDLTDFSAEHLQEIVKHTTLTINRLSSPQVYSDASRLHSFDIYKLLISKYRLIHVLTEVQLCAQTQIVNIEGRSEHWKYELPFGVISS